MPTSSLLSIARTALTLHQTAIDIVGQNVANAETEGYSRQRVESSAALSVHFANIGHIGTGVRIDNITRARDALLDQTYRTQRGGAAGAGFSLDVLQQLEGVVGEPASDGFAAALDAFWSSWSDLATNPTNKGAQGIVRQRGELLAGTINRLAAQVDEVERVTRGRMETVVGDANQLMQGIADVNRMIVAGEADGRPANDLRDARDRMVDRLSQLADVGTVERGDGSLAVYVSGLLAVDGVEAKSLKLQSVGTSTQLVFTDRTDLPLSAPGGEIGAALDAVNVQIPAVMGDLDTLAATLVDTVNGIHTTGVVWDYTTTPPTSGDAPDFFQDSDPKFRTARLITLSDEVKASAANVAVSAAGATGPANNAVALQLAELRDTQIAVGGGNDTLGGFWRQIATRVGLAVRGAESDAEVRQTLAENADVRRQSVSGVATDDELVALIKHQQAYSAAARLVTVAEEMSRILVDLGR